VNSPSKKNSLKRDPVECQVQVIPVLFNIHPKFQVFFGITNNQSIIMMKYVLLAVVFAAVALARPQEPAPPAQNVTILKSSSTNDGQGTFMWSFEESDGTKAEQEGHTVPPMGDSTDSIQVISGSYSYVGPDGKTYSLTYVADQNGFQPKADFLPTPPTDPNNNAAAASAQAAAPAQRR
jgi:hypothetical protein